MNHLHIRHHWLGRLLASDPGRKRFQQAGKATISLISSVLTTLFILRTTGNVLITPAIVSGITGMLCIMVVMDETKKKKQVTTLLMGVSGAFGITSGSLLAGNAYYLDVLMLVIIFSSFYFTRFEVRYFSLCMLAFMTVYISSVLKLSSNQLPLFYMGILLGVSFAFFYNFILFKDSAQILKRSMRSFHIQINLTFNILIRVIQDPEMNRKRMENLEKNVRKLSEYARNVSGDLNEQDVKEIWPGLKTSQLRLYVFDTEMLVETLTDTIKRLKKAEAFETDELKRLLIWVVKSLRDAEVLDQNYVEQNLEEAEKAVQAIRFLLTDLLNRDERPNGWLFLIRRIESISNHVIKAAYTIQQSLMEGNQTRNDLEMKEENSEEIDSSKNEKGLKLSTKKAYQALVAGTLSIIVGMIISPTQPYWVLLTAFIVLLGTESIGRTYIKGFERSFGTVIGAAVGFGMAKLVSGHSILEIILLFLVIFLAFYLFSVSYTLMSVFITMLIAFMYDLLLGGITFQLLEARVIDTIAGAAIALSVSTVIFPKKTKDKVADTFDDFLTELNPYVTDYVKGFREDVNVKELTDSAFSMDQKLQSIKDEARSLLQRPGALSHSGIARWITIFTAINYFARHLIASSYRKNFDYPDELVKVFIQIEEKLDHNIETLRELIKGTKRTATVYSLKNEREQIERLAPSRNQSHRDLIHHLYYVWRINQSLVALAVDLGAREK
ncbi:FUSC family protein [Pseudalkalibacillus decolorationis]|uniref:FUSC family protein n=1 Tax=Pseudalkalibacillus decolorationis TaxID=163879 RepID=UPI0021478416|nr:FUSC family protein [Pseudalkalibacillus decolorationis]